jgi:hypothetical protein
MADAAHSVVSFQDAQTRVAQLREQLFANPADGRSALSDLDPSRVRGLLGR